jgi:predicted glutamine amidotransferase
MCRLLGYVADHPTSFEDVIGEGFQKFVDLSHEHKHGWGIATCSIDGKIDTEHDLTTAALSPKFAESRSGMKSDAALLHLRLASKGLTVDLSNNHPFVYGKYSFMHNGTIRDSALLEKYIDQKFVKEYKSSTDTEKYFYALLTSIEKNGLVEGIRETVAHIVKENDYSSINAMLLTPEKLVAICQFNEEDKSEWTVDSHYELRYLVEDGVIKIASTGWGKDDWIALKNHSILLIDRKTQEIEVLPL